MTKSICLLWLLTKRNWLSNQYKRSIKYLTYSHNNILKCVFLSNIDSTQKKISWKLSQALNVSLKESSHWWISNFIPSVHSVFLFHKVQRTEIAFWNAISWVTNLPENSVLCPSHHTHCGTNCWPTKKTACHRALFVQFLLLTESVSLN